MPGMPRRLFSATPSKLGTYADCPRRYRFAYLTRPTPPKGPPWAHNTVGSAVHAALRSWWELALDKRTPAAARQLLYGLWSRTGFRDDEQADRWRARAAGWLTDYVTELDPADEPVGTERTVGATTERLALSGRIDRIDSRGDELVVVDYKTGRVPSTADEARGSPALAIYVLGVRRTLRRAEDIATDIETATEAVAAGQDIDAAFPPVTGQQCSWCDFRPSCPAGQAAVPAREPWSFLAE
jgi:RecB family exonuclease